mgnify:FL=1
MQTFKELLELDTPFLTMNDIKDNDWQRLDFELEKYDRTNRNYDVGKCKVLAFVIQQIHYDKKNFYKIPLFIRMSEKFQALAIEANSELNLISFYK